MCVCVYIYYIPHSLSLTSSKLSGENTYLSREFQNNMMNILIQECVTMEHGAQTQNLLDKTMNE